MEALTAVERELLLEFREKISDIELKDLRGHDMHLVTWLRARDHNLKKAEEMFRKADAWIRANDMENLVSNWKPPENYRKEFAYELCGFDPEDSPVLFARMGQWDMKGAIEGKDRQTFIKYQHYTIATVIELVKARIHEKNKFISQFVIIIDMEGYSFRQLTSLTTVETQIDLIREFEANYPETLKACYIININKLFGLIFNLVKPVLPMKTISKVHAFDSNSEQWKSILDNNELNVDDTTIFSSQSRKEKNDNLEFELAAVKAGDLLKMDFEIEKSGTVLGWKFKTDGHDIGFGVIYSDPVQDAPVHLIGIERKSANHTIQENSLICSRNGKYTLVFDNSYSRFRSKTIYYNISITHNI